jgi:hypothetical protein
MHIAAALIVSLTLGSQVFFKSSNRLASIFDCLSAVRELYSVWRGAPALTWLVGDLLQLGGGNKRLASGIGFLLFVVLPGFLWFQNFHPDPPTPSVTGQR